MNAEEQSIKPTLGEQITELYGRVAKLNDIAAALLNPNWGANVGIIPEGHPLYPDAVEPLPSSIAKPTAPAATEATGARDCPACGIDHEAPGSPTGIRGLLEHVGIDTTGRDITVAGEVVDAAPAGLREQIAAAIESEVYEYRERTMFWEETVGVTQEIARLATRGAMEVRDRETEQLREQLAARDAALAACTAQLVHDQTALAAAKKCARGIGAWGVLQAIDNASTPAPDGGPTVAEAAANDEAHWSAKYDRP